MLGIARTITLITIGFIVSHLFTAMGMSIIAAKPFHLYYPFALTNFYLINLINFRTLPTEFHIFFWSYIIGITVPFGIHQTLFGEQSIISKYKRNKYGYAKFATPRLIKKMGLNFKEGIVFGLVKQKFCLGKRSIIRSNQPLSTLIIAPTGTGKTAGFIIPTLKTLSNSVVIFDIKGELHQTTSQDRINLGHRVLIFDVIDGIKFNPFARNQLPQDLRKLKSYIKNISNLLFESPSKGGRDGNYFVNSAKELFNTIALYLIIQDGYTTIPKIKGLLLSDKNSKTIFSILAEKLEEKIENIEEGNDRKNILLQLQHGINQILQISEAKDQFLGVIGSLTTILAAFDDMEIQEILDCENSSIVADDLRKQKITIYIRVKDIDLERLRPLVALFFDTLISDIISNTPTPTDNQITFILDEFGNLGKVSKLIKATTISRSYKLNQIFILQDLAQISSIYSVEERSILESNTAYKIILQQNNFDTAKRISEIIGFRTDTKVSKSSKSSQTFSMTKNNDRGSISSSQEGIYLVTPQDILNLNKNHCLIIVQGFSANVILADIAWWFKQ